MIEKIMVIHQSLMLLIASGLIVMLFQIDNSKRLGELEHRQTNHLTYLESRLNSEASKLDKVSNSLDSRLNLIELRQTTEIKQKQNTN